MRNLTFILAFSLLFSSFPAGRMNSYGPTPGNPATIKFEEIATKAGLRFVTQNSPTANKNQVETMVAGVALLDYDGDGYLDIYLVNGAAVPSLQKESPAYWNRLFRNNHDGTGMMRHLLIAGSSCSLYRNPSKMSREIFAGPSRGSGPATLWHK